MQRKPAGLLLRFSEVDHSLCGTGFLKYYSWFWWTGVCRTSVIRYEVRTPAISRSSKTGHVDQTKQPVATTSEVFTLCFPGVTRAAKLVSTHAPTEQKKEEKMLGISSSVSKQKEAFFLHFAAFPGGWKTKMVVQNTNMTRRRDRHANALGWGALQAASSRSCLTAVRRLLAATRTQKPKEVAARGRNTHASGAFVSYLRTGAPI